jgi:uncharacterized cupredoxin-like copper-binding protein
VTQPSRTTSPGLGGTARGLAAAAVALGVLTACGGTNGSGATATPSASASTEAGTASSTAATGSAAAMTITATETEFRIALQSDHLPAGSYRIEVVNDGSMTHALEVERGDNEVASSDAIDPGKSTTLDVTLQPGTYVFYCPIDGHRQMGMEVTVEVTA